MARRNLPIPRIVIDNLDRVSLHKTLTYIRGFGCRIPHLEMYENTLIGYIVIGALLVHHIDAVNFANIQLIEYTPNTLVCDVGKDTRNAKARLINLKISSCSHFSQYLYSNAFKCFSIFFING